MNEKLVGLIAGLQEKEAIEEVKKILSSGNNPLGILSSCDLAMEIVGKRFEEETYFIPDLLMSGQILKQISGLVASNVSNAVSTDYKGKILIGTVEGDIHDIGKDIVIFLLEANGFKVIDIGVNVPAEKFVEAIIEHKPQVVGMSALLTLAFESLERTIQMIKEAGLRDKVKIMIGGGQVNERVANYVGADVYCKDAQEGVRLSKKWCSNNTI